MKRIYFLPIVLLLLSFGSCKKYLDTKPTDFLSTTNYYQTESQLDFARAGVYNSLGNNGLWGSFANYLLGWQADEAYMNRLTLNGPFNYNYSPSDQYMNGCWNTLWDGINRANVLLANLDKNPAIAKSLRDKIRGECLFLRGYYYFMLVQYWGDVPIKLIPTGSVDDVNIERSPVKDVYVQILADMTAAEPLVPGIKVIGNGGAISKSAVRGILARVCLTMAGEPLKDASKYQDAKTWAKKVMDDGESGHNLNPSYSQIFINLGGDKYDSQENIWEVEFYGNNADAATKAFSEWTNNGYINGPTSAAGSATGNAPAYMTITSKFYNVFQDGDLRKWFSIAHFSYLNSQVNGEKTMKVIPPTEKDKWVFQPAKWRREYEAIPRGTSVTSGINMAMLRYSDVLLMFAEAENAINGPTADAIAAVNKVRQRGWSSGIKAVTVTMGGAGYTTAPTVTFSTGNGSTAEGIATISGGAVTGITLSRDLTGITFYKEGKYSTPPAITITGGGGSGATATATIYNIHDGDIGPAESASKQSFLSFIQDERMREFNMEGQRKADLLRWGTFLKVNQDMGNVAQQDSPGSLFVLSYSRVGQRDLLMPIPDKEITNNQKMVQNPGW
ncbi:MAG: RagB/SusD family nutrient uptake outer membrane protein [Chitinophagaceae bacterium]